MHYRAIYKCRLCGEEENSMGTGSTALIYKSMLAVTADYLKEAEITLYGVHSCKDGSKGLSDFQGWRKIETQ